VTLVLDASVLVKLFRSEPDSIAARAAVEHSADHNISLLAPGLAVYEVLSVALHYQVPFDIPIRLFDFLKSTGFLFVEPTPAELRKAELIATTKTPAAGFPALKDSIYHAVAIMRGGTFLTADRKHIEKAKDFGHVQLLADWRPA
jgi:predicted nucleic acid-binding protein